VRELAVIKLASLAAMTMSPVGLIFRDSR
jgi:hypothetical protein